MDFSALMSFHQASPIELMVRGTVMYWFLFLLFRFVLRRDMGSLGVADVLFIVIVADAAQNGMSGTYDSIAEGFVLVGTLAFWNYMLDWGSFHVEAIHRLTEPRPLLIIKRGRILRRNLRHEFLTVDDIHEQLRQKGITDIRTVRAAYMEGDGEFSVLTAETPKRQDGSHSPPGLR
jgi:uncharacterized membrane protein YcaP (DUF421 family)